MVFVVVRYGWLPFSYRTRTISTTRILHTIEVHIIQCAMRHNFVTGILTLINVINPSTHRIRPREDHHGRRARTGGRTMYKFWQWGTNVIAHGAVAGRTRITGRTLGVICTILLVLSSVQESCCDGTTGSTTTNNVPTANQWFRVVQRKAQQECGNREHHKQRSKSKETEQEGNDFRLYVL